MKARIQQICAALSNTATLAGERVKDFCRYVRDWTVAPPPGNPSDGAHRPASERRRDTGERANWGV